VEHVGKRYGELMAVDDLSFDVGPGELLGLVGPNGAGKTTALRAIAGILRPTTGRILVDGHDVHRSPVAAKRALAFVPDTPQPFENVTVTEHLRFTAMAWRIPDAGPRIESVLEEMTLVEKRDALGSTLSRGMRQKLAFACAFLRHPSLLLLDEPLTGLDPKAIREVRTSIRQRAEEGAAVIVSSHLLDVVERLCGRILVLHRGRGVALGSLEEIREGVVPGGGGTLEEAFFAITERDGEAGHDDAGTGA
jgi:ABC-2 type transport system ATP-binding protein